MGFNAAWSMAVGGIIGGGIFELLLTIKQSAINRCFNVRHIGGFSL
jgi:hypothetical protein